MIIKSKLAVPLKRIVSALLASAALLLINCSLTAVAASDTQKYYIGEAFVNTGKDNGFSGSNEIGLKDSHYGWKLGRFVISGYTSVKRDAQGNPVFLKNLGDRVTLSFILDQDIDKLNGAEKLLISEDKDGYDKYFGIPKTNFGRGALITRHTDYQNLQGDPQIYNDFLSAKTVGADTVVELFEEGDYEVALNYELKNDGLLILDSFSNYRIFFKFSVRNGNCMVFPKDIITNNELTNSSLAENGFYLDLAKSRYLSINVKREVLVLGADDLTEDTRFNRPAKDGEQYTDEGIYVITVKNQYAELETVKKIYVGTNNILKAYMRTGYSIKEINEQTSRGAQITNDGTIIPPATDCIVYPYDVTTNGALSDNAITNNGFYLDLSNTQHLEIAVFRDILTNVADELTRDNQFNSFAKEGDLYTGEGIYTIIALNRSTEQQSTMRICVGTNNILKAHMLTALSIKEINTQLELGAQITDDGEIILPVQQPADEPTDTPTKNTETDVLTTDSAEQPNWENTESVDSENASVNSKKNSVTLVIIVIAIVAVATVLFVLFIRKRKQIASSHFTQKDATALDREEEERK